jgi:hypothetical protein
MVVATVKAVVLAAVAARADRSAMEANPAAGLASFFARQT